ncbi:MAG: transaldolase family protein, partial [Alphaproteobacteria bacterium]
LTPDGLRTCRALADQGTPVNVTLCFSAAQAILAAKAGAADISPFVGRLDDIGTDGMQLIADLCQIYRAYPAIRTEVLGRVGDLVLPEASRRLVDWVAQYTMSAPGAVLRMAMSVPEALEPPDAVEGWTLSPAAPNPVVAEPGARRVTAPRRRVLEAMASMPPATTAAIARAAGVGAGVVRAMAEAGWLVPAHVAPQAPPHPDGARPGPALSADQDAAARELAAGIGAGFRVTLLDGVTGAGKTEVYFEAIAAALRAGRQALVLLPEIAMSAQWLARFEARCGAPPASWHSELGQGARQRTWRDVASGEARVVVGARSALFLPYRDLGVVVVDEEHEQAFKQEDGVVYHARDMA